MFADNTVGLEISRSEKLIFERKNTVIGYSDLYREQLVALYGDTKATRCPGFKNILVGMELRASAPESPGITVDRMDFEGFQETGCKKDSWAIILDKEVRTSSKKSGCN